IRRRRLRLLRAIAARSLRRRGRVDDCDRMEGISRSGFGIVARKAQAPVAVRRAQSIRPRARARSGNRVLLDRPPIGVGTKTVTGTPAKFSAWRERVAAAHVLVVGDVMLDRYWFGDVERISPEAPVAVAKIARTEERPGGAANVARNIAALGASATLLSVTGDDEAGNALERLLERDRVTTLFLPDAAITTTLKLRVIARQQQ